MSVYRRRVMQVKHPPNQITAVYNVTSTTSATTLFSISYLESSTATNDKFPIERTYIDGVEVPNSTKSYTFSTLGEHKVVYVIRKNGTRRLNRMFAVKNLIRVDMSECRFGVSTIIGLFQGASDLVSVKGIKDFIKGDISSLFAGTALETIDIVGWDMSQVTNASGLFRQCTKLQNADISKWKFSDGINLEELFSGCTALQSLNLRGVNFATASSVKSFVANCTSLQTIILDDVILPQSETASVAAMFTKITAPLDVSSLVIGKNIASLFGSYAGTSIVGLENWDTSSVVNMTGVFSSCEKLKTLEGIRNWDTSSVTTMYSMFYWCRLITDFPIDEWDLSNVTSIAQMFMGCWQMPTLNVSSWDVRKVTSMDNFLGDTYYVQTDMLQELDLSNWNLESCTSMMNAFTYRGCRLILPENFGYKCEDFSNLFSRAKATLINVLDKTKINVSNAQNVNSMFYEVARGVFDISMWDLSKVTNWNRMFAYCSNLEELHMSTEINKDAILLDWSQNDGIFKTSNSSGSGIDKPKLYYFPYPSFEEMFLPIVPSKWEKIPTFTIDECTSLTISADNVPGTKEYSTIHWSAVVNGHDLEGNLVTGVILKWQSESEKFGYNTSEVDVVRELSFTYMGVTATTTITQYAIHPVMVAVYDVTKTDSATQILSSSTSLAATQFAAFDKFIIDGEICNPTKTYVFSTLGEHEVKFVLKEDGVLSNLYCFFYSVADLKRFDASMSDMSQLTGTSSSKSTAYMFYSAKKLESVVLPASLPVIGDTMFSGCIKCSSLTILSEKAPINTVNYPFGSTSSDYIGSSTKASGLNKLYVPAGATGYDTGRWADTLLKSNKCGFTKVEI